MIAKATPHHDADTEQRILDAAHAVFLRRGTAGARMQEIAAEAQVNQALLHYYFRSKDRLAEAVFRRAAMRLVPPVLEILASDEPLADKVDAVVRHELDRLTESPHLPGYIIAELTHHPERAGQLFTGLTGVAHGQVAPRVFATLRRQIDDEVAAGRMRRITPEEFVVNLVSLCIFPFAGRPLITTLLGLDDRGFEKLMRRRRRELPQFFMRALRP